MDAPPPSPRPLKVKIFHILGRRKRSTSRGRILATARSWEKVFPFWKLDNQSYNICLNQYHRKNSIHPPMPSTGERGAEAI